MKKNVASELHRLVASVRTADEAQELLAALLTPAERHALAERWQIVHLLLRGTPQREISETLGVGVATVTRGAKELKSGRGIFQKFHRRLYGR